MTEIRPMTPDLSSQDHEQGKKKPTDSWLPDGQAYGKPRALTDDSYGVPNGENAYARAVAGSVHSEPDIDTILPLPGTGALAAAHAQMVNVVSPTESEEEEGWREEGDGGGHRVLHRFSSEFTTVEHPLLGSGFFGDDLTAQALEVCKKTVLQPYLGFLKVVGWRKFRISEYDLEPPLWQKALNVVWPLAITLLLITSCVTQIITCFRRDLIRITPSINSDNETFYEVRCERHILTTFLIPDILLLSAFLYGLYIFRWAQTEQLSTLTEAVFLALMTRNGRHSHRRLTISLQLLMVVGALWIVFSFSASIFRIFSLHLLDTDTQIQWIPSYQDDTRSSSLVERWVFVVVTLLGFILLDMAYSAVVVNYTVQCQLLVYLIHSICDRMRTKDWEIEQTIKEIKTLRDFLSLLNSHLSRAMSLLLFIFLTSSVQAFYGLQEVSLEEDNFALEATAGILSAVQWTFMLVLPLLQAARVTRAAMSLKKTGLEIRSRPYSYVDTPQLDLDSLVVYTSGLKMSAKLVSMPISPAVVSVVFFTVGFILFLVFQYDSYSWAKWL